MAKTTERRDAVVCPYCGLYCDDLSVAVSGKGIAVTAKGCPLAKDSFAKIAPPASPRIAGRETSLEAACARAAEILNESHMPLVAGLACDLAGAKAAMALAERIGAVVDHAGSEALFRNTLALQDKGWIATTFAEVKNRADLVIVAGTDVVSRFPRFFERFVFAPDSLFDPKPVPEIVYLGGKLDTRGGIGPGGRAPASIECETGRLSELFRALRALYRGWALQAQEVAGVPVERLAALAGRIKAARYGIVVWSAADLEEAHGELAVQAICDLVADANETTRMSGVPLGGSDNVLGAAQVCTWQAGFPLRTGFARGVPHYDPYLYSWRRLIESGEADAVLWISAFKPGDLPFETKAPVIALAAAGSNFVREPEVSIPVGTPGVDHAGHVVRADAVTSLPLHALRESTLPRAADVLRAIEVRAGKGPA